MKKGGKSLAKRIPVFFSHINGQQILKYRAERKDKS